MSITMMDRRALAKVPCGTAPGSPEEGERGSAGRVCRVSASSALGGLAAALPEVLPRPAPCRALTLRISVQNKLGP